MSFHAMPFLMINMGMEMLFILHVRLRAQNVESSKGSRVLTDVVKNLCNPSFINEVFRPQAIYSITATRDVFTSLATSSAMHLSTHSMKKLFELMLMGLKYQVIVLNHPLELVSWTLNHMEEARRLIAPEALPYVDSVYQRVVQLCQSLSVGALARVRQTLLNYCLDKRIKVSLFLEEHVQNMDGSFSIPPCAALSPAPTVSVPGEFRYFEANAVKERVGFISRYRGLAFPPSIARGQWNPYDAKQRLTTSGRNVYLNSRDSLALQEREMPLAKGGASAGTTAAAAAAAADPLADSREVAVKGEVNYLARLVGQGVDKRMAGQTIQLSFFEGDEPPAPPPPKQQQQQQQQPAPVAPEQPEPAAPQAASEEKKEKEEEEVVVEVCKMNEGAVRQQNQRLLDIKSGLSLGNANTAAGTDLLDIMDDA